MNSRRNLALMLTLVGILLALGGPFIPGGVHLVPNHPYGAGHVTSLIAAPNGDIVTGTQAGDVWRFREGIWTRDALALGGQPVMAMLDDPKRTPVGTAAGLANAPIGTPPLEGRVGSLLRLDQGLLAGTANGVRVLADDRWLAPGPQANVYALHRQKRPDGAWLHAGTIDAGVLSAPAEAPESPWQPNNQGLPDGVKVFSLATTPGGLLLAATDRGLFWQDRPGRAWRLVAPSLDGTRLLSLYLAPGPDARGAQRLWFGSDKGLYWMDLAEDGDRLTARTEPHLADAAENQPTLGISWIVPHGSGLMISAGAIYEYGPVTFAGWYWISLAGVVLILVAGGLMPRPEPVPEGGRAD